MENASNKLEYVHIEQPTKEILQYIDSRRRGAVKSLKTRWHKFNRQCMGGIEPNTIYSVCGISGSGKSAFANSLETDLFELNPNEDFVVLSFNFEMLASKQVGRKISYRLKKTTAELYSGLDDQRTNLTDSDYEQVVIQAEKIKHYPIYYVDRPGNVEEIQNTIVDFYKNVAHGRWMLIIIDHTLLIKDKRGESERKVISDMQRSFMELKKFGKTSIVQLSQMNREIEDKDRISNHLLHYPVRRDIAASDSVFQASDIVIVLHRPELLGEFLCLIKISLNGEYPEVDNPVLNQLVTVVNAERLGVNLVRDNKLSQESEKYTILCNLFTVEPYNSIIKYNIMARKKRNDPIEIDGITLYHCTKCDCYDPIKEFEKRYDNGKLRSHCKGCRRLQSAYYHRTVIKRLSEEETWFELRIKADPELSIKRQILRRAKLSAKKKNLEFNLTPLDINLPEICPILKKKFIPSDKKYTWSIDRVDNLKGYIPNNVQIISRLANTMKNNATPEELELFANNIKDYIKI